MPGGWSGSTRKERLPSDWPERRARVLERDRHQCTVIEGGERCIEVATEVDHVVPGDDHRDENLASICSWHHGRKSSREGNRARWRFRARRPPERHPGLI